MKVTLSRVMISCAAREKTDRFNKQIKIKILFLAH